MQEIFKGFTITCDGDLPLEQIRRLPFIEVIEEDTKLFATQVQDIKELWGLDRLDQTSLPLDKSYTFDLTGNNVNIYLVDSGVDLKHPELAGRAVVTYTAPTLQYQEGDETQHGTHTSSIAAGTNVGVAKRAKVFMLKVIDRNNESKNSDIVVALDFLVRTHTKPAVLNMSLGPSPINGVYPRSGILDMAVRRVLMAGITVVAAAGNDGINACTGSPASTDGVITVSAIDQNDNKPDFASFGECVSFYAPGQNILAARAGGGYVRKDGTSQAAPFVTGVAALYLERFPDASPQQVLNALREAAAKNLVPNSRSSQNFIIQSVSVPQKGSEAANRKLVDLAPASSIIETPIAAEANIILYVIIAVLTIMFLLLVIIKLHQRHQKSKKRSSINGGVAVEDAVMINNNNPIYFKTKQHIKQKHNSAPVTAYAKQNSRGPKNDHNIASNLSANPSDKQLPDIPPNYDENKRTMKPSRRHSSLPFSNKD
ncbi:hypothetical protein MP638_001601 [Amoeboaphelidium occidentale]|nr:hypothetical protein MP638_001601 [Amoeboaphelidium occidentale]